MAKIVMIGGGSYNWTPHLVRDMVVKPELAGSELWLVDINKKALSELEKYCRVLVRHAKSDFKIFTTTNRIQALPNADFIVITISTGGLEAMRADIEIPYKYGIYQPVGDTVGPGGISRALRNIPVFLDLAAEIKKYCSNAWILNITNPMTVLTQILCQQGCKTIGLCHELYALWGLLVEHYKCQWDEIGLQVAGLNHFGFILSAKYKNKNCFTVFEKMARDPKNKMLKANVKLTHSETHVYHVFKNEYFRRTGRMLYPGDRHTSEFFSNVLTKDTGYGKAFGIRLTTIRDRYKWIANARKNVLKMIDHPDKIDMKPSREAMSSLIVSLTTGKPLVEVVNLPNIGQIDNLPRGVVVETMGTIGTDNVTPHTVGALPDDMAVLLNHHAIRFNMVIDAAVNGDRRLAQEAMASDPLVREWNTAGKMLDQLLKANKKYLPQF